MIKVKFIFLIALLGFLFSVIAYTATKDESQVTNLTTDLNLKLNKSGDTMSGTLNALTVIMKNGNLFRVQSQNPSQELTFSVTNNSNATSAAIDLYTVGTGGNAQFRYFRNTNTSGQTIFQMFVGNNTNNANVQLGGNTDSYLNALLGNVSVGKTTVTSGYKIDINGKIIINNNITMSNTMSCIQMKNDSGVYYTLMIMGTNLTAAVGTC